MAFKISGDFEKKIDRWKQLLETSQVIVTRTSRAQAEAAISLIGEGFEDETDPYDRKWAKKKHPDGRKVLHGQTSRLRTGWHVVKTSMGGWRVDPSVEYAAFHQAPRGGSRPKRMQVPSAERGLPKEWAKEFEAIAMAEAFDHFAEAANGGKPHVKRVSAPTGGSSASSGNVRKGSRKRRGIRKIGRIRSA